ncbi:MAG: zinc-ribbon domain-containing protein [Nitrososphaerales archaeon]
MSVQAYCPKCGQPYLIGQDFCRNCGQPLKQDHPENAPVVPPLERQPASHRKRNILVVIVVVAALVALGAMGAVIHPNTQPEPISVTSLNYIYECSNCASNTWNYSFPFNYVAGEGSTYSGSSALTWPSTQSCSAVFTNVYSVTPGFTFTWSPLPFTATPGQSTQATIGITSPTTPYSGQLNVVIVMNLSC